VKPDADLGEVISGETAAMSPAEVAKTGDV